MSKRPKTMPVFNFAVFVFAVEPPIPMAFVEMIIKIFSTCGHVVALITPVKLSLENVFTKTSTFGKTRKSTNQSYR